MLPVPPPHPGAAMATAGVRCAATDQPASSVGGAHPSSQIPASRITRTAPTADLISVGGRAPKLWRCGRRCTSRRLALSPFTPQHHRNPLHHHARPESTTLLDGIAIPVVALHQAPDGQLPRLLTAIPKRNTVNKPGSELPPSSAVPDNGAH
ncbi:hypothetical protein ACCO45_008206 [Purpureocillium lilacinum]|uniref:Uncharacterized protein n=1 Tax=Purpureocillium lilacinum TaxID=33203 RepID=A0ACC4DNE8_PURLI